MNYGEDILEQFENLRSIEPSPEWNQTLFQKLDKSHHVPGNISADKMAFLAIVFFLSVNFLSFIENRLDSMKHQELNSLKKIATELLINTDSSKY